MRTIVNSTYISLDGVVVNPHMWPSANSRHDQRSETIQADLIEASDVLIMGRATYDVFAPAWTTRSGDRVSDRINTMPKIVVSSTMTDPTWANTRVVAPGDIVEEVARLKAEGGGHILQYGVGVVTRTLMEQGLLDELRLWTHPVLVGAGAHDDLLFRPSTAMLFDLVDTTVLGNGIIVATYRVQH